MVEQAIQVLRANLPRGILLREKWVDLLTRLSSAGFTRLCMKPSTLLYEDEAVSPFERLNWFDLEAIVQRVIYALTLLSIDEVVCEAFDLANSEWMRARTNHSQVRIPYWRIAGAVYTHNVVVYRAGTEDPYRRISTRVVLRAALQIVTTQEQARWAKQITHPGLILTPFVFPHGANTGKDLTGHLLEQVLLKESI